MAGSDDAVKDEVTVEVTGGNAFGDGTVGDEGGF